MAIADNFDAEHNNIMAPFLFAMNEVYLRNGSRKVKDMLKSKREKYWYLSCTHQRRDIAAPCQGVRILYAGLVELVRQDPNSLLALSGGEMEALVQEAVRRMGSEESLKTRHRPTYQKHIVNIFLPPAI